MIAFPRGAGLQYAGYAEATGASAIGLDTVVPLEWAAAELQGRLGRCVQGNLDPQMLILGGPAMQAEAGTHSVRAGAGGPFVFNLGHGINLHTPPGNVLDLAEQVRGWRGDK